MSEDISEINDYTQFTDLEALINDIELLLRQRGLSVDIRQGSLGPATNEFLFRGIKFTVEKRGDKQQRSQTSEPSCVAEMWEDSPDFYPFLTHRLTELFGIRESVVITGERIPREEEKVVLSALATGAKNAKCAFPVFVQTSEYQGEVPLVIRGLLLFSGLYVSFDVFDFNTYWKTEPDMQFVSNFRSLLSFFLSRIDPRGPEVTLYSAYKKGREKPKSTTSFDVVSDVYVLCRWASRSPELVPECIKGSIFDLECCSSFRIQYDLKSDFSPSSDLVFQLEHLQKPLFRAIDSISPLSEDLPEAVFFDDTLLALSDESSMFPINSLWTKVALKKLFAEDNFTVFSVKSVTEHLRRFAERGVLGISVPSEFELFPRASDLHKHTTIIFAALHCAGQLQQLSTKDPNSRLVFLHQSSIHEQDMRKLPPEALRPYSQGMVFRILKALLVDKFMSTGTVPEAKSVIDWHKGALKKYPYYRVLCKELDDGEVLRLWDSIATRSFSQTLAAVVDELVKESELSLQYLESVPVEEISRNVFGLCISCVVALTIKRQAVFFRAMRPDLSLVAKMVKPAFREFRKAWRQGPTLSLIEKAAVENLHSDVLKLETAINVAFSLSVSFSKSPSLYQRLSRSAQVDVLEGSSDFRDVLDFIASLGAKDAWQSQTLLRTDKTRLSCSMMQDKVHVAVARVHRERLIE